MPQQGEARQHGRHAAPLPAEVHRTPAAPSAASVRPVAAAEWPTPAHSPVRSGSASATASAPAVPTRKSPARRALHALFSALAALAVLLAVALVGVRLVGLTPYAVLSGSMEPTYHTGSVVYVKQCDPLQLEEGTAITFMLDESTVATHRIVEVVPDEDDPSVVRFRTQGDANDAPDGSLVHCNNVIGTPVFTIPGLGYLANYIQHPPGTYVAISVCAVLVMLTFLPDLFERESPSRQGEGSGSAKERRRR